MLDFTTHEQEVKELFEKLSVEIPGTSGLRAINLEAFKMGVEQMMNKAYFFGSKQTLQTAEDIIDRVFNKQA
jgi:hypothetical protein